jgi:hypothetical protein
MTNNKQQTAVELYTEKEIRRTFGFEMHEIEFKSFMNAIKPIDLPTDEEIEKESFDLYANHNTYSLNVRQYKAFKRGAKWMRDKIQGGEQ